MGENQFLIKMYGFSHNFLQTKITMQKIHMIFNLDAKKKLLILFQKSLSKENVYLVCLGRLQSVRDRQFGLIFNQLKVRESMY